jgi:hypothetical protein
MKKGRSGTTTAVASIAVIGALATFVAGCSTKVRTPSGQLGSAPSGKIQVLEFDLTAAQVASFDEPTTQFGMQLAEAVAESLRKKSFDALAVARSAPRMSQTVVDGRIVKIDGGSRATRYLVGFGAGAARFGVAGQSLGPDGAVVGEFKDERWCGFGLFGGASSNLLHNCMTEVADDVATMVATGNYRASE